MTAVIGCNPGSATPMPHSAFRVEYEEFNVPRTMKVGEKVLADHSAGKTMANIVEQTHGRFEK